MKFKRVFLIVIDSVGIGTCPDSDKFGDKGANTIGHIAEYCGGISLPTMQKLGYGNIEKILGVDEIDKTIGYYGKMRELSNGKDTMTGHWEMMGIKTTQPFITFTETGFPKDLIDELSRRCDGRPIIGNCAASGTEIIKELGKTQEETGALIVYTSADSVLQIAANEKDVPIDLLYRYCSIARELTLKPEWRVGRVIARPYITLKDGTYSRTTNRHDYALNPTEKTTLNSLNESGYSVISVGKISDIFNAYGISEGNHITSNHNGMEITKNIVKKNDFTGLCFVNLVDFDALYGHRRDPKGYHDSLEEFDKDLGELIKELKEDDLLMVTADHGNDPTWKGTDHTREYVPLLVYHKNIKNGNNLGVRRTFADLGQTIAHIFEVTAQKIGVSFLEEISE